MEPVKVNFSEEAGVLRGTTVGYVTLVAPRLALPARVLSDLSRAKALAAAWVGMNTLVVLADSGPAVSLRLAPADVEAWRATHPDLIRLAFGAEQFLLDAPPPPGA
jgi:hypothetical protein